MRTTMPGYRIRNKANVTQKGDHIKGKDLQVNKEDSLQNLLRSIKVDLAKFHIEG